MQAVTKFLVIAQAAFGAGARDVPLARDVLELDPESLNSNAHEADGEQRNGELEKTGLLIRQSSPEELPGYIGLHSKSDDFSASAGWAQVNKASYDGDVSGHVKAVSAADRRSHLQNKQGLEGATYSGHDCAISAHGDADGILPIGDVIDSSLVERKSSSADDMLAEIQNLVRENLVGDQHAIAKIQDLAKGLLNELGASRDDEQKAVSIDAENIRKCNTDSESQQKVIRTGSPYNTVNKRRSDHESCRGREGRKEEVKHSRCSELDSYLLKTEAPASKPPGSDRDEVVAWVLSESAQWCPRAEIVSGLSSDCRAAEKEYSGIKAECDSKQGQFELAFCQWRQKLLDECSKLETCYANAVNIYEGHVAIAKDLVKKWKTEHKTLHMILCFVDVWMKNGNASTVDANQYNSCNDIGLAEKNYKGFDIDYGDAHAKATCNTEPVDTYPGNGNFKRKEYSNFRKYAIAPHGCIGEDATTTAESTTAGSTTAESTTTTPKVKNKWRKLVKSGFKRAPRLKIPFRKFR